MNVLVQPKNDSLEAIATEFFPTGQSSRDADTCGRVGALLRVS